jgi:hypothetical protein
MSRGHVEPGGETRKPGSRFLHARDCFCRYEFCPLCSEEIREIEQEEPNVVVLGIFCEIARHIELPLIVYRSFSVLPLPQFAYPHPCLPMSLPLFT